MPCSAALATAPLPRCRTGSRRRRTSPPPSGRSRRRCGLASPPRAAPSRRSSRSSSSRSGPRSARSPPPATGARRLAGHRLRRHRGRHGLRRRRGRCCAGAAAWSSAGTSTATRPWAGTATSCDYVEGNKFFEHYRGPADDFFGSVGSKPEIYPIYWSPAQMQARQNDRMARVQAFLNAPVEARVRGRAVVRPGPGLAVPGPHPPPARRAPTRPAWAPTWTRAPSTCG